MVRYQYTTGTTTTGSSYREVEIPFGHAHELVSGDFSIGIDVCSPRYIWVPYGGDFVDMSVFMSLQMGQRVPVPGQLRDFLFRDIHSDPANGSPLIHRKDPSRLWNVVPFMLVRRSDANLFDFTRVEDLWGSQVDSLTVGNTVIIQGVSVNSSRTIVPPSGSTRLTTVQALRNVGSSGSWQHMLELPTTSGYGARAQYKQPNVDQILLPASLYFNLAPDISDPVSSERFDYLTYVCLDCNTMEFVPPMEEDLDIDDTSQYHLVGPSYSLCMARTDAAHSLVYIDNFLRFNPYSSLSGGLSYGVGNTGSLKLSSVFDAAAVDDTFMRFVQYLRPSNLSNPFSVHPGWSITASADDEFKFITADADAFNTPTIPMVLGHSTFVEYHLPSAAGAAVGFNIFGMTHGSRDAGIESQRSITPPDFNNQAQEKLFFDMARTDGADLIFTTKDGLSYNYEIGFKNANASGLCFGSADGSTGVFLPIRLGFVLASQSLIFQGRVPRVRVQRSS